LQKGRRHLSRGNNPLRQTCARLGNRLHGSPNISVMVGGGLGVQFRTARTRERLKNHSTGRGKQPWVIYSRTDDGEVLARREKLERAGVRIIESDDNGKWPRWCQILREGLNRLCRNLEHPGSGPIVSMRKQESGRSYRCFKPQI